MALVYKIVLRPGFEPGSRPREGRMIGRTTPPELTKSHQSMLKKFTVILSKIVL